jgi:hypothetical protein
MAKYYIKSGVLEVVLDAPTIEAGVFRTAKYAMCKKARIGVLVAIGETGFHINASTKIISFIPFLRQVGADLPSQERLFDLLAEITKKPVKDFDDDLKRWYLEGDDNFDPKL